MALIFAERDFLITTLCRLPNALEEDIEDDDDSLSAQVKGFLSATQAPGAAIVDMLVNVDAIYSVNTQTPLQINNPQNIISNK